jgi:DNA-binding NarL/FixJ family response regulator
LATRRKPTAHLSTFGFSNPQNQQRKNQKSLNFYQPSKKGQIMNHASYSERLDYLLELIEKGAASSPKQISKKFDCNEKTIRNMIYVFFANVLTI